MLAKYDTIYLRKTKKRSVFLSSVHLRSASIQVAPGKKIGHLCLTASRCKWIGELAAKCLIWKFWKATKPPIKQASIVIRLYFV